MTGTMAKLLIVDDDPVNIFALTAVLKSRGWETWSVTNAAAGLQLLEEQEDFQAVLLDMMMPGTDGYEMIGLIRQKENIKEIPVIAITAQAMKDDREKCLAAGADNYLSKPVDVDRLFTILNAQAK
jgi:CheY-like chemotaxis protein